jgi:hypothetical protein
MKVKKYHELDTNDLKFIHYVLDECLKNNVGFSLTKTANLLEDKVEFHGSFFDGRGQEQLEVAFMTKDWFLIMIHEYCHMRQFLTKSPAWTNCVNNKKYGDTLTLFFLWLAGKNISKYIVEYCCEKVIAMEADAEMRAVEMKNEFNLSFDPVMYTKEANSYLYLYRYMLEHKRKWPKKMPAAFKQIVEIMPDTFSTDNYKTLPEGYQSLVSKHCY